MSERTGDKADTSPQPAGSATRPTAKKGAAKKAARKTATRKRTGAKAKPDATTPARAVQTPDERKADTAPSQGDKTPVPPVDAAAARPVVLLRTPMTVRWSDLDAFNHVNNSRYLTFLEEARLRWMIGVPGQGLEDGVAPVVAAAHLNYRRPIEWPANIAIELFVERLGNTSLSIGHRIVDEGNDDTLYCDGNVVMVWIDRATGQAAPLPDAVREACSTG